MSAASITAGTPLRCPYCEHLVRLVHDVDVWRVIRCKCGGLASASLWAARADVVRTRHRMN